LGQSQKDRRHEALSAKDLKGLRGGSDKASKEAPKVLEKKRGILLEGQLLEKGG